MRIIVLGGDGFCGWPTSLYLSDRGHDVTILDNLSRRNIDNELEVQSLTPITPIGERLRAWHEVSGREIGFINLDLANEYDRLVRVIEEVQPEAIVHFAEQRAAPYSMVDRKHAVYTQVNNVVGTMNVLYAIAEINPDIHLVKLGTMGAYGEPNIDIEEGWLEIEHKGRKDRVLFPKRPGSFYHLSKVHDSHNIEFACRIWGIRATDLNQGIVYGQQTPETERDDRLATRYDYDAVFGTVLNRFVIQSVLGLPLMVYGNGSQVRGIIEIRDTVRCLELACENPADRGEFRVFNQMTQSLSITQMAQTIARVSPQKVEVEHLANPRVEEEGHHYNVVHSGLFELGLDPHMLSDTLIESLFEITKRYAYRVRPEAMIPTIDWRRAASQIGL